MIRRLPGWYTACTGAGFLLQSSTTLLLHLFSVTHVLLHMLTRLLALVAASRRWARGPFWCSLGPGIFYTALALLGTLSGHPLGLSLTPAEHPVHLVIGAGGLFVALVSYSALAIEQS